MQTTGFHTRLLKRIDTWSAVSGPEEKKIRIYRRIMFHRTTLLRLSRLSVGSKARDGAASFTLASVFINTSRAYTDPRLPNVAQQSFNIPAACLALDISNACHDDGG